MTEQAEEFYAESLKILNKSRIPFLVGGTLAFNPYVGMSRVTKDMDIFCKASDFPKIVQIFSELGFKVQTTDERWLGKVLKARAFFDVIFNSRNALVPVTDEWFAKAPTEKIFGVEVKLLPPTELLWSKVFVEHRLKYDGNDVAHLILKKYKDIDWQRILNYMDQYWEVLLIHLLNFRFIYPSERELVPRWLLDELLSRLKDQENLPTSKTKICRGRLYSTEDFEIDVAQWGFADLIGEAPHAGK
ncbi:MAG: nucleotidyltransferase family protein [Candidatus Doudnabacteria bacterium]|nr:nucleotidyltransferase family protein [Candidatus Doudnabacteria bacterium]